MDLIGKLSRKDLVIGLPKVNYIKDRICDACQKGKQVRSFFQFKKIVSTSKPLDLLHMDLIKSSRIRIYRGNSNILVIVGDYSRFTWILFLKHKSDTFEAFKRHTNVLQNEKGYTIVSLRSDHGSEFENNDFSKFCEKN